MQSEGLDILKTDGTAAESLKGAPQDHHPCADDVCSPTERKKGPSQLHSAGISLGSDTSLQVRIRDGEGLPRSHSKPMAKGSQTLMLWCPLTQVPGPPATCLGPRTGSGTNICWRDVWRWVDVISKPGPTQTVKLQALISGQRDSGSSYLHGACHDLGQVTG